MTINISRGYKQQNSVLTPSNVGVSRLAKQRVMSVVSQAVERNVAATNVDGTPCEIYIRQQAGRKCSCTHTIIDSGYVDDKYSKEVYSDDFGDDLSLLEDMPNEKFSNNIDIENLEPSSIELIKSNFDLDPQMADFTNNEMEGLFQNDVTNLLFGGDKSPCPICFGTGFTDGYRLVNGYRTVCDVSHEHSGIYTINNEDKPYSFVVPEGGFVLFHTSIPKYYSEFLKFQIYDGVKPINALILLSSDGITWIPLTYKNIESLKGINKIYLKVLGRTKFTHIDLVFRLSDFPKIDMPAFAREQNFQYFEALATTSIELPGNIAYVDRECVIGEAENGFLWKVISATPNYLQSRQLYKTDLECRLIQRSEALYLLNSLYRPQIIYNQQGLERIQGLENYILRQYENLPR